MRALNRRKKVAVYCSDVSGAFDRVRAERNSEAKEFTLPYSIWRGLGCSNDPLRWSLVVEGQRSDKMLFRNMVFQGTVLGPTLWDLICEDARRAVHEQDSWKSSMLTT